MFQNLLTGTYVRVTITPEQMFGVNLMVHSWEMASAAPASSIHKSSSIKSRRIEGQRSSVTQNWKMARGMFFLFAFLILFSGFALMHTFASSSEVTPATSEELIISVDSGDTLWDLARTYKKDSMDTRQAVHHLLERNGLSSSSVKAGQSLIIPARMLP
jgi:LysM repeat protein